MGHILSNIIGSIFMTIFALIVSMMSPFTEFTFTDAADFGPSALIVLGLVLIGWRHFRMSPSSAWRRFATTAAIFIAMLAPFIAYLALTGCMHIAWEAIGHQPHPMIDDPKYFAQSSSAFRHSSSIVTYSIAYSGALIYVWLGLIVHLWRQTTRRRRYALLGVFMASWMLFVSEPRQLFMWWLD